MELKQIIGGGAIGLVALILGYAMGSGGPDTEEIQAAVSERIDAAQQAQSDHVAELKTALGEISGRLDGIEAVTGLPERIGADLKEVSQSLGTAIGDASSTQLAALENAIGDLRANFTSQPAAPAPEPASDDPATAAEPSGPPEGLRVGQTALISDGAVRTFISRIDDSGRAMLRINGQTVDIGAGESYSLKAGGQNCVVTLGGVDRGHVQLLGACGGDLPTPEGTAPGRMASFADGAVRVFVSGVTPDGARIAVNGVNVKKLAKGETIDVEADGKTCKVRVLGIDRGHVALDSTCGS